MYVFLCSVFSYVQDKLSLLQSCKSFKKVFRYKQKVNEFSKKWPQVLHFLGCIYALQEPNHCDDFRKDKNLLRFNSVIFRRFQFYTAEWLSTTKFIFFKKKRKKKPNGKAILSNSYRKANRPLLQWSTEQLIKRYYSRILKATSFFFINIRYHWIPYNIVGEVNTYSVFRVEEVVFKSIFRGFRSMF